MRTFLLLAATGVLAMAQPSFQNQQRTTGVVGIVSGQTARLNVLYSTAPAPIAQVLCTATLAIADDSGAVLASKESVQLIAGRSVSLDLNADTALAEQTVLAGTVPRTQVHGFSITPSTGCQFVTNLEIIDNATQKTVAIVGSQVTFPFSQTAAGNQ